MMAKNCRLFALCAIIAYLKFTILGHGSIFELPNLFSDDWLNELKTSRESSLDIDFEYDDTPMTFINPVTLPKFPFKKKHESYKPSNEYVPTSVFDVLPPKFRRHFAYFLLIAIPTFAYAFLGYLKNHFQAKKLSQVLVPFLKENFAQVGENNKELIIKRWHAFEIYSTGRTSCRYFLVRIEFVPRQCIWHAYLLSHFFTLNDYISFEVPFFALDCIVFAICLRQFNKQFIKDNLEIAHSAITYEPKEISQKYRAYINSTEKDALRFANFFFARCQKVMDYLYSFYISDLMDHDGHRVRPCMVAKFTLPPNNEEIKEIVTIVLELVDYAKNFQLENTTRERITKTRHKAFLKMTSGENRDESKEDLSPKQVEKLMAKRERKNLKMPKINNIESAPIPKRLEQEINRLKQLQSQGLEVNRNIDDSIEFKNPYLLEKIMRIFNIDGYCSNYDPSIYDPQIYKEMALEPDTSLEKIANETATKTDDNINRRKRSKSGWSHNLKTNS
ncbi:bifunctional PAT complex subunit CCDC47/SAP30-binding protein [Babesia duncani]|uniref:Bifunctional PAT complex subunit CCDC47/SAP30-binding protein n=1 Tax=Babesia duncani TaxID=323732 RepID=A0AAD9PKM5_9APIC|nr:bifunctional PAT complex subunit CCDC47/SAP30-binding protein [Babesia duncani]